MTEPKDAMPQSARYFLDVTALCLAVSVTILALSGVLLGFAYTPASPWDVAVERSGLERMLVASHRLTLSVSMLLALVWLIMSTVLNWRLRSRAVRIVAGVVAVLATTASAVTWPLVQWQQVALWEVTVGIDMVGLLKPAYSEKVRFLLINGAEVSQSTYATWLLIHLITPFVALLSLAVGWAVSRRRRAQVEPELTPDLIS